MTANLHPVKAFRKSQNPPWRLQDMAVRLGRTKATVSRIENKKQPVSDDLLPKLVEVTGIPANILRPDLAKLFRKGRAR